MGWLWPDTSPKGNGGSPCSNDLTSSLDASLQSFLEEETPAPSAPLSPREPEPKPSFAAQIWGADALKPTDPTRDQQQQAPSPNPASPPPASQVPTLHPDGRYAHLWSAYTASQTTASAGTNPTSQVQDIITSHRSRKTSIARAAKENCADLEWAYQECLRRPSSGFFSFDGLRQRMTLCNAESEAFGRCVDVQGKFLRALGYASIAPGSTVTEGDKMDREERVKMHADKLFHGMIEQERIEEESEKQGGVGEEKMRELRGRREAEARTDLKRRIDGMSWLSPTQKQAIERMDTRDAGLELDALVAERWDSNAAYSQIAGANRMDEAQVREMAARVSDEGVVMKAWSWITGKSR